MRILQTGAAFLLGVVTVCLVHHRVEMASFYGIVHAQSSNVPTITHIFSGTDGQSHIEQIDIGKSGETVHLLPLSGEAELHRGSPGAAGTWHTEHQRQYVVTLSGHGEIEVAEGQKVSLEPGQLELVEDLTGKGHISKTMGREDRVTLWLPLADQTVPTPRPSTASGNAVGR